LALGVVAVLGGVSVGSASVRQESCTTPVYENGLDIVFGRGKTQAAADKITRRATTVGFQGVKTVRENCKTWKSALRGINSFDIAVGIQTEARRVRLYPTLECVTAQEIGQIQAIFGTRRTLDDLRDVIAQANRFGYVGLKVKTAPCGGYQTYVAGFTSWPQAESFAAEASQRTGLHVVVIKA
jgi:hypothetical protein